MSMAIDRNILNLQVQSTFFFVEISLRVLESAYSPIAYPWPQPHRMDVSISEIIHLYITEARNYTYDTRLVGFRDVIYERFERRSNMFVIEATTIRY